MNASPLTLLGERERQCTCGGGGAGGVAKENGSASFSSAGFLSR